MDAHARLDGQLFLIRKKLVEVPVVDRGEAAAAQAAMAELYGTVWKPKPGDRVRCPLAFGGGYQNGTVYGQDNRPGSWLVDTPEGQLRLFTDELQYLGPGN